MIGNRNGQQEFKEKMAYYKTIQEKNKPLKESVKDNSEEYQAIKNSMNNKKNVLYEYNKFVDNTRDFLIFESLNILFQQSNRGRYFMNESTKSYGKSLVARYIKENGSHQILKRMKEVNSLFSVQLESNISKTLDIVIEAVDKNNPETYKVSQKVMDNFYDNLDDESFDEISELIKCRVTTAVEEFVNANREDKDNIETLLQDTKDKIDSNSQIAQEATNMCKIKIGKMKERTRNVFEEMVYSASSNILKDTSLLESFTVNGKFDMDTLVERVQMQYTLLEMLSCIKLEKSTEESIAETLQIK